MCGIHLFVERDRGCTHCQALSKTHSDDDEDEDEDDDDDAFSTIIRRRGPDSFHKVHLNLPPTINSDEATTRIFLQASVLQMRQDLVEQPLALEFCSGGSKSFWKYFLCWNGEVYQAVEDKDDHAGDYGTSDTRLVANRLAKALDDTTEDSIDSIASNIATVMGGLYNAEFAFVLLRSDGEIFYGRDAWGRRSLLRLDCEQCRSFHLASTAPFMIKKPQNEDENSSNDPDSMVWSEVKPGMVHATAAAQPKIRSFPFPFAELPTRAQSSFSDRLSSPTRQAISEELSKASSELEFHLSNAVKCRLGHHSLPTAVLFSGGLDSAVVAALAARHCETTLYLYNVSFGPSYDKSADRQAALVTHERLQTQYPDKKIIFQDIVVDWDDICREEPHVRTILQPKTTLMDVNIAMALWFASGGGKNVARPCTISVAEPLEPRVLLLGMGADELLGGYGRHRKAFERGGWEELQNELDLDQSRFWERNLGRDDRIVADHGREARFPFLDPHVTQFLQGIPLSLICDFSLPPGQGDKRILRLVAQRLGIDHASGLVKRAIQFGSRISHLSDAKRFGSRRKAKGDASVKVPL